MYLSWEANTQQQQQLVAKEVVDVCLELLTASNVETESRCAQLHRRLAFRVFLGLGYGAPAAAHCLRKQREVRRSGLGRRPPTPSSKPICVFLSSTPRLWRPVPASRLLCSKTLYSTLTTPGRVVTALRTSKVHALNNLLQQLVSQVRLRVGRRPRERFCS